MRYSRVLVPLATSLMFLACTKPDPNSQTDAKPPEVEDAASPDGLQNDAAMPDASEDGACNPDDCPLGCNEAEARCNDVDPSNGLAPYLDMAAQGQALFIPDGSTINTNDGTITNAEGDPIVAPSNLVAAPTNGAPIRVFSVKSLTIGDTTIDGDPAIAFVSDRDIVVNGIVVVDAGTLTTAACRGGAGECTDEATVDRCGGDGGSGFGSAGGGGDAITFGGEQAGGAGGRTAGTPELIPLRGGCGVASFNDTTTTLGGGGIQLTSRTEIRILGESFLDLNGDGGFDAVPSQVVHIFGGGSGGGALLEAPVVIINGTGGITANGGGGSGNCSGADGDDGQRSTQSASGGQCSGNSTGGDGAAGSTSATGGVEGGSGGGGVGRIRINTIGQLQDDPDAVLSPEPSIGTIATR